VFIKTENSTTFQSPETFTQKEAVECLWGSCVKDRQEECEGCSTASTPTLVPPVTGQYGNFDGFCSLVGCKIRWRLRSYVAESIKIELKYCFNILLNDRAEST